MQHDLHPLRTPAGEGEDGGEAGGLDADDEDEKGDEETDALDALGEVETDLGVSRRTTDRQKVVSTGFEG